jgi:nitrile hydratase subunit alpha
MAGHGELPIAARARRLEERVLAAGLANDDELDAVLTHLCATASLASGARIVAHAWTDAAYRDRLLTDADAAAAELGFPARASGGAGYRLKVVANRPGLHNMIVCTLCSCYPTALLGPSPGWYKSLAYRSRAVREPRVVLAEFGLVIPAGDEIAVWDSSAETRYMVLPRRPAGTEGLAEDDLAALVTRNGLIGTAAV